MREPTDMSEDLSSGEDHLASDTLRSADFALCSCCRKTFSTLYCATSLAILKAMLFDRVTGHTSVQMPQRHERSTNVALSSSFPPPPPSASFCSFRSTEQVTHQPSECYHLRGSSRGEILLPLCDRGRVSQCGRGGTGVPRNITQILTSDLRQSIVMDDTYKIDETHWICASCVARLYAGTVPPLVDYTYDACVSDNGTQTTWYDVSAGAHHRSSTESNSVDIDGRLDGAAGRRPRSRSGSLGSSSIGMRGGRRAGGPSVRLPGVDRCCAPGCDRHVSSVTMTMFLVIAESQYSDYTRMRQCWLNECTRTARLRKLIRDLQHYLLFDQQMHSSRLRLSQTDNALRVEIEREVDLPPHQRAPNEPPSDQVQTLKYSATRAREATKMSPDSRSTRTTREKGVDRQLQDNPPCILLSARDSDNRQQTGVLADDHDLREPRERWLFEALGLHHDFDQATMPINAQALTRSERFALKRAIAML